MAVPDLARNTPIAQVINPVIVNFFKSFRQDFDLARLYRVSHQFFWAYISARYFFVYIDKPLFFDLRFNNSVAAAVGGDSVRIVFIDFRKQAFLFEFFDNRGSGLGNMHTREFTSYGQEQTLFVNDLFLV